MSYSYQTTNPRAATSPLRSMVWNKPAHQVLGWTERQTAAFELNKAIRDVAHQEANLIAAYQHLGSQNGHRNKVLRRIGQSAAMRLINSTRSRLRAARKALTTAHAALLKLTEIPLAS